MNTDSFLVIIVIVLLLAGLIFVPQWRTRRAVPKVIKIFRQHNALGSQSAKTMEELGIRLPGMLEGIATIRDYKRYALKAMLQVGIVQTDKEGKLYLVEERLANTKFSKPFSDL